MNLEAEYRKYVEDLTGTAPAVTAADDAMVGKLPLYLRSYYRLVRTRLFGRRLVLAVQNPDAETATPAEYARHHGAMRASLDGEVVLVLPRIAPYGRQQLVRQGVPFVVPHRQAFLPPTMVDLHERFPKPPPTRGGGMTAAAQVVLLRHLLGRAAEGVSLRELAADLGYSAMTLSNVRGELEALGLCAPAQRGRSTHLVFPLPKRALWERAEPHLRTPVNAWHWVRWGRTGKRSLSAGLTALAGSSLVSDDEVPTSAMKASDFRAQLEKGSLVGCPGPEDAEGRAECWTYDPRLLSDGPAVDGLSLYLSLRGTHDERVAKALKDLLESQPW